MPGNCVATTVVVLDLVLSELLAIEFDMFTLLATARYELFIINYFYFLNSINLPSNMKTNAYCIGKNCN